MTTFKPGQEYGNDLTIKVLSRTAKTVTIETNGWGVKRLKIRNYNKNHESISFKSWLINSKELFDAEISKQLTLERAYFS